MIRRYIILTLVMLSFLGKPALGEETYGIRSEDFMDKLDSMNSDEIAQNWMKNISSAMADENYYQMDKNHDNCVTREEYIAYNMQPDKDNNNEDIKLDSLDYSRIYIDIKKENKNCLTKEEYITDENNFLETTMEEDKKNPENDKEYAAVLFEYIDKDSNGKITAEEYAEYHYQQDIKLSAPNQPILKKETYQEIFFKSIAPNKGWQNKEEFIEYYVK